MINTTIISRVKYDHAALDIRSNKVIVYRNSEVLELVAPLSTIWFLVDDHKSLSEIVSESKMDIIMVIAILKKLKLMNLISECK